MASIILILFVPYFLFHQTVSLPNITTDQSTLMQFKNKIIDPQNFLKNWVATKFVCNWTGVACSTLNERVTSLDLSYMGLIGNVPSGLGNLSSLESLTLSWNNFSGILPEDFVHLRHLRVLNLLSNNFTGPLPQWLFTMSNLETLILTTLQLHVNNFSGELPKEIGKLQQLEILYIFKNSFSGVIPDSLSNCSMLRRIQSSDNFFINSVSQKAPPPPPPKELSIITSLTNCRNLEYFIIYNNPLISGTIPKSIGNFSLALKMFHIAACDVSGIIPDEIGNLRNLTSLYLDYNILSGHIPSTIKYLQEVQGFRVTNNQISGHIPVSLCQMSSLAFLRVDGNRITGKIPECIGTMMSLREMDFSNNLLDSIIPLSLWNLTDVLRIFISLNKLNGSLSSNIGNLEVLEFLDLSGNRFSGNLPTTLRNLKRLEGLVLENNSFEGPIPESLGNMINLEVVDFSNNNLSGVIPKSVVSLRNLKYFDVSFNKLIGEIPNEGPFLNFSSSYFTSNEALCGNSRYNVSPCISNSSKSPKRKKIFWWIFVIIGVSFVIVVLAVRVVRKKYKQRVTTPVMEDIVHTTRRISYYEIMQSTEGFNSNNLLGEGGFGKVYKGVLNDGTTIATKVFKPEVQGAFRSFEAECEALRNIRHRNLVKVISSCSNTDFKALVLEYMPHGSLDKWLHSDNYFLDFFQRLNMLVDVADAMEYLHHGFPTPIVHCDLKPSNILLDEDMSAHVSDFSLTKFMNEDSCTHTKTLATLGYIAPEYGSKGIISRAVDVYSFGILLMETFTAKKPSDEMFTGNLNLKDWVHKYFLKDQLDQIIDSKLLNLHEGNINHVMQCVYKIIEFALNCCEESPKDRMNMKDVGVLLDKIKLQFQTSTS